MPKEDIQENHDVAEEATEQTVEPSAEKPPWEKDGEEFDAARAWKLIQNLRAENTAIQLADSVVVLDSAEEGSGLGDDEAEAPRVARLRWLP